MKGFSKRIIGILMIMILVMSMAGCTKATSETKETKETTDTATDTSTSTDTEEKASDEKVELVLWSIATESDSFRNAYVNAIADFEAAHPDVTIRMESFENESYKTKIKTAVAANDLPDLFFTWGGGFAESFVESGKVLAIDDYYNDEYQAGLSKAMLVNATYDGKLYGSTYSTPLSMLYYNKRMFNDFGLEAPTTIEELKAVSQTFIDNDIKPFGISAKDTWVLAMMHDALTLKSVGPTRVNDVLKGIEGSYNDPDFIKATSEFKELIDMGAFIDGAAGLSNDEASQLFYNETVPMFITGSWMAVSVISETANQDDFDMVPVPMVNSDNAKMTDFIGGPSDTIMVAASTKYPDIAGDAVFELTRSISKHAYLEGSGIAAWAVDYDESSINPLIQKIAKYASSATSFTLFFDNLMPAEDAGEYLALLQELFVGNITPEELAESMDKQLSK